MGWLLLRLVVRMDPRTLVYFWLVVVGASYFDAAWKKWALSPGGLEWVFDNDISNLFVASHLNGWLPDLSDERVLSIAATVHRLAVPIQLLTFVVEVLPLVMLVSRRLTIALLLGFVAMHLGIYAASGINFWKWSFFDLALVFVLVRSRSPMWWDDRRRSLVLALIAVPVVLIGGRLGFGSSLGWFDTRLTQCHSFWAYADDGGEYQLGEIDFAPYDKSMSQDRFYFLHDVRPLVTTLGATNDYLRFVTLQDADTPELFLPLVEDRKPRRPNLTATEVFDDLVRKTMRARNAGITTDFWPARLSGPMHIQHGGKTSLRLPKDVVVTTVRVRFHEVLYTGSALVTLNEGVVHETVIEP
jgi:hypothetical protein